MPELFVAPIDQAFDKQLDAPSALLQLDAEWTLDWTYELCGKQNLPNLEKCQALSIIFYH